jgi:hypothetical protein
MATWKGSGVTWGACQAALFSTGNKTNGMFTVQQTWSWSLEAFSCLILQPPYEIELTHWALPHWGAENMRTLPTSWRSTADEQRVGVHIRCLKLHSLHPDLLGLATFIWCDFYASFSPKPCGLDQNIMLQNLRPPPLNSFLFLVNQHMFTRPTHSNPPCVLVIFSGLPWYQTWTLWPCIQAPSSLRSIPVIPTPNSETSREQFCLLLHSSTAPQLLVAMSLCTEAWPLFHCLPITLGSTPIP